MLPNGYEAGGKEVTSKLIFHEEDLDNCDLKRKVRLYV